MSTNATPAIRVTAVSQMPERTTITIDSTTPTPANTKKTLPAHMLGSSNFTPLISCGPSGRRLRHIWAQLTTVPLASQLVASATVLPMPRSTPTTFRRAQLCWGSSTPSFSHPMSLRNALRP